VRAINEGCPTKANMRWKPRNFAFWTHAALPPNGLQSYRVGAITMRCNMDGGYWPVSDRGGSITGA